MDKNKILQSIRKANRQIIPLPNLLEFETEEAVVMERFIKITQLVGGKSFQVAYDELDLFLKSNYPDALDFRKAETMKAYPSNCPVEKLAHLKTVILEGQFGVAENGAIYIDDGNFSHRLIPFINEELIVCLDSNNITSNMHTAYTRISNHLHSFGLFVSGPSKTADIEQNLVLGAHGPKSFHVILCN